MITENLSTLKIHKLSEAQYQRELAAGRVDPDALYLTPTQGGGGGGGAEGGVTDEALAQAILAHNTSDAAHADIREALHIIVTTYATKADLETYINEAILGGEW